MLTYIQVFVFATLLLCQTEQSVPGEDSTQNVDTWKTTDVGGGNVDNSIYYYPSVEERDSLLRDLRSLRERYYKPRSSAFPYYKGLGRK